MFPPLRLREALKLGGLGVGELVVRTWKKVNEHEVLTRAAAIAFYAMLALVPFLGLVLHLAVQLLPDVTRRSGNAVGFGNLTVERSARRFADDAGESGPCFPHCDCARP